MDSKRLLNVNTTTTFSMTTNDTQANRNTLLAMYNASKKKYLDTDEVWQCEVSDRQYLLIVLWEIILIDSPVLDNPYIQ